MLSRAARSDRCLPRLDIDRVMLMVPFGLFAATGDTLARLDSPNSTSVQTTIVLGGEHQARTGHLVNGVMCVAVSPLFEHKEERGQQMPRRDNGVFLALTDAPAGQRVGLFLHRLPPMARCDKDKPQM
jgi:hypothetical protein